MVKDFESYERVTEAVMRQRSLRKVAELYVLLFKERGVSQSPDRAQYRRYAVPSVATVLELMKETGEDNNWDKDTQNTETMMQAMLYEASLVK